MRTGTLRGSISSLSAGGCFRCFASPFGKVLLLLPENAVSYPSNSRRCRNTTTATAYTMILKFLSSLGEHPCTVKGDRLRGIGRHPSMPSAWIGLIGSNLLASTVNSFTDVTVKSNRTGNIPRRLRGIVSITSLCARQRRALSTHFFLLIAPMPPTINSTNFSSLVSTALPIRFALILNPYG